MLNWNVGNIINPHGAAMSTNDLNPVEAQSQLFTVRLWQEALGNDLTEVRAEVRHVLSGETRYFRDWDLMIAYLHTKLTESQ
jgi:hypothetical protein